VAAIVVMKITQIMTTASTTPRHPSWWRVEAAVVVNHKNVTIAVRGRTSVTQPDAALVSIGEFQRRFLL
jgi:hypothetical protein